MYDPASTGIATSHQAYLDSLGECSLPLLPEQADGESWGPTHSLSHHLRVSGTTMHLGDGLQPVSKRQL